MCVLRVMGVPAGLPHAANEAWQGTHAVQADSAQVGCVFQMPSTSEPSDVTHACPPHETHACPSHVTHACPSHETHACPSHVTHACPSHVTHACPSHTCLKGCILCLQLLLLLSKLHLLLQLLSWVALARDGQLLEGADGILRARNVTTRMLSRGMTTSCTGAEVIGAECDQFQAEAKCIYESLCVHA